MSTVEILFDENEVSQMARRLLALAREQTDRQRALLQPISDGRIRVTIWSSGTDDANVLSIPMRSEATFTEWALYMGIEGLDPKYQSGAISFVTGAPLPTLKHISLLYQIYGRELETSCETFTPPAWIADVVARGSLDDVSAMNRIADEFYHVLKQGEYRPAPKGGTKPDTSLWLGPERKAWLKANGGIQPTLHALIDKAMQAQAHE